MRKRVKLVLVLRNDMVVSWDERSGTIVLTGLSYDKSGVPAMEEAGSRFRGEGLELRADAVVVECAEVSFRSHKRKEAAGPFP